VSTHKTKKKLAGRRKTRSGRWQDDVEKNTSVALEIDNQIGKNAREKEATMQKPQKKSTHRE